MLTAALQVFSFRAAPTGAARNGVRGGRSAAAALVLAAALLSACGGSGAGAAPGGSKLAIPARAVVDGASGVIRMPLDEFSLSPSDLAVVITANDLAMSRCMERAGQGRYFPFVDRRNPPVEVDRRYGVWVRDVVAKYGYGVPPASERSRRLLELNRMTFPPEAERAYQACIPEVKGLGLAFATPPDDTSAPLGQQSAVDSKEAVAIEDQWRACLVQRGVAVPPDRRRSRWLPAGVVQMPLVQQITVGLVDVECKAQVGLVQRLADLEAAEQVRYIQAHESALLAQRQDAATVLATARRYLSDGGLAG